MLVRPHPSGHGHLKFLENRAVVIRK